MVKKKIKSMFGEVHDAGSSLSEKLVEGRAAKVIGKECYLTRPSACTVGLLGAS